MDKTLPLDKVSLMNLVLQLVNTAFLLFFIAFIVVAFIALLKYIRKH